MPWSHRAWPLPAFASRTSTFCPISRQDLVERQTAVSILAHIGPLDRFPTAEDLISYAGLAPGHRQSDDTRHNGKIGGGGTDSHLRHLLIESMQWVCQIPRYRAAFERAADRPGEHQATIWAVDPTPGEPACRQAGMPPRLPKPCSVC